VASNIGNSFDRKQGKINFLNWMRQCLEETRAVNEG
jgi:hypothetical protein